MSGQGSLSYTIVISGAPYSSQAPGSALAFCRALVRQGHRIDRVFLYGEGVLLASLLSAPPSDEENLRDRWCDFLAEHQIEGMPASPRPCAGVSWTTQSSIVTSCPRATWQALSCWPALVSGFRVCRIQIGWCVLWRDTDGHAGSH